MQINHIYDLNSPVDTLEIRINTDQNNNRQYFQISLKNLSQIEITSVHFKALTFQDEKIILKPSKDDVFSFILNDIRIAPGSKYMPSKRFYINSVTTIKNIEIIYEKVVFSDGGKWKYNESDPSVYSFNTIGDENEVRKLRKSAGNHTVCYPKENDDYWLCSCGRFNSQIKYICDRCSNLKDDVMQYSKDSNNDSKKSKELIKEYENGNVAVPDLNSRNDIRIKIEKEITIENNDSQKNNQQRTITKIFKVLLPTAVVLFLVLTSYFQNNQNNKYKLPTFENSKASEVESSSLNESEISKNNSSSVESNNNSETVSEFSSYYSTSQLNTIKKFGTLDDIEGFVYGGFVADELGYDLIYDFNDGWINYVNYSNQDIFDHLILNSPAYKNTLNFRVGTSKQKFLQMDVKQATIIGGDMFVKVYESLEITKPESVEVKNYNWIYHAKLENGKYKIYDYYTDEYPSNTLAVNESFVNTKSNYYTNGSFLGGDITDGISIQEIRFGNYDQYDRFVLDCFEFDSLTNLKSNIVPFYNVVYYKTNNSALFYFNGVREFVADLDVFLRSNLVAEVYSLPVYDDQAYAFIVKFKSNSGIKVFEIENNARIVVDIKK